ncbi:MAG: thioredoxin family protein [Bacteroidales bacterium]|nr:thioredoxin family protein [Bacteroidales bacterium]MBO7764714.1 thioredoxin family protein [Bacteroidales bacterium]
MRTFLTSLIAGLALLFNTSATYAQDATFVKTSYNVLSDGNVELVFDVQISDGWYMYSATPVKGGPMTANFDLSADTPAQPQGAMVDGTEAHTKFDSAFGLDVYYFEGNGQFKQIITPSAEGNFTVQGTLVYQTCNGEECLINENDITVNVKMAGAEVIEAPKAKKSKDESLLWFLLIAFAAGLGGVITPCVFPMIPMTVGFLIGGTPSKRNGIMKGLVFGLSVVLIYTLLGLIVSLFGSTAATDALGTHWIPNLLFAALFIVFSISFLGAFEITLPSGLANKADRQADKGGYIGAFFVAVAMVIVSFSCTGPFVGSILAAAVVGGVTLKPILGMAVFGAAFSLPFVVCSFFPGMMKKLPKSGGWLNVVKVVFAFVLMAFAVKFLYNVDAYFGWGIITRLGFLAIWITLVVLLGLYFLGVIRTDHDSPVDGIGWGRMLVAIACFSFAFYLIPGLFGAPLKSVSGMIPPMDGSTTVVSAPAGNGETTAPSGYSALKSYNTLDEAMKASEESGKPLFITFKSHTCSVCKVMEATVLNDPTILSRLSSDFVVANLYVDDKTPDAEYKTLGRKFRQYEMEKFGSASQPLYAVIDHTGKILSGPVGNSSVEEFGAFLNF